MIGPKKQQLQVKQPTPAVALPNTVPQLQGTTPFHVEQFNREMAVYVSKTKAATRELEGTIKP